MSGDVLPRLPKKNTAYQTFGEAKMLSQRDMGKSPAFIQVSYFYNLFFGYFYTWVSLSFKRLMSSFTHFISVIICLCSHKYMVGVAAGWIVTLMAAAHTLRYWAVRYFPSMTMNKCVSIFNFSRSVSFGIFSFKPYPTGIRSPRAVNIHPKVFGNMRFFSFLNKSSFGIVKGIMFLTKAPSIMLASTIRFFTDFHLMTVAQQYKQVNSYE